MSQELIVLYGALRSGTTLMRLILDGHPDISCSYEHDYMFDYLSADGATVDLKALSEDRVFIDRGVPLPTSSRAADAFHELLQHERSSKKVAVLSLHRNLARLQTILPDARIIHMVRDPRDVARSSIGMGWAGNTWHGVEHWLATERDWDALAAGWSHAPLLLRYEDLIQRPEAQLQQVCEYIGVPYDGEMLEFSKRSTYKPLNPSLMRQWTSSQRPGEIADVESRVGGLLAGRGYSPSRANPRSPGTLRRAYLAAQNKLYRWRFQVRRHGLVDSVGVKLARILGVPQLMDGARHRIAARQRQFLQ